MTSFLDKPTPWGSRRHTTDHIARSTANTPAASRSSSVASNDSRRSEPSWYSAYNGQDTTRKDSMTTTGSQNSNEAKKSGSGFSGLFTAQDPKLRKEMKERKEAEKKRRKEDKHKEIDKIVITSKHAAAVRTKLATDPKLRRHSEDGASTAGVVGTQNSAHLTAAQQEMRFPHSGPPAMHGGHKARDGKHDMPALTRIVSGDERDEEEEMLRRREEWLSRKRPDIDLRHLSEGGEPESPTDDDQLAESLSHTVLDMQETPIVGVELQGEQYTPKPYKERHGHAGFKKAENGAWTKPRDGPHILHNV